MNDAAAETKFGKFEKALVDDGARLRKLKLQKTMIFSEFRNVSGNINRLLTQLEKGIDESRLVAKGYGESEPMVENDTEENKAKNRRVELKVIGK